MNQDWYEIWVDESPEVPYVLLLCPNKSNSKELLIIDPQEKNAIVQTMSDYEFAILWLTEDEYTLVHGRMLED